MACQNDLHNNIKVTKMLAPAANNNISTTPLVSAIIDTAGYGSLEMVIMTGALTDADAVYSVLVEDGDNSALTDNVAVDDAFLLGTEVLAAFTFANDGEVRKIGYIGKKRYVRMTITPTTSANSGDTPIAILAIQGSAVTRPVA